MVVCDDGNKVGGEDNGAVGSVGGGDIKGGQLTTSYKHTVRVCNDGVKSGGEDDRSGVIGQVERWTEVISGGSTHRLLQARCGRLRRRGQSRGNG